MYNTELEVAKKAEQMLEAALRQKTSSFRNHINRNPEDKSLKDATAKATGVYSTKIINSTKQSYHYSVKRNGWYPMANGAKYRTLTA